MQDMFYINKAEEKTTSTGKQLKKLELSQEGKQYPLKGVTIWSDNPLYAEAVPGASLDFEIYETDSGTPNPNAPGKNYVNRSVSNPNRQGATQSPAKVQPNVTEYAIKTHVDQHFSALRADLKIIADHLGVEAPKPTVGDTDVPYPAEPNYEGAESIDPETEVTF